MLTDQVFCAKMDFAATRSRAEMFFPYVALRHAFVPSLALRSPSWQSFGVAGAARIHFDPSIH
jgi:hypothetical protein